MSELRITLVSDGSSDRALLPILTWLLRKHHVSHPIQAEWADFRSLPRPPKALVDRILVAQELWPSDVMFVHRDAENEDFDARVTEIQGAVQEARRRSELPHIVCVVPIRMHEAWLLIDESAIRRAAGNPNGKIPLVLPRNTNLERIVDPKGILYDLLRQSSELTGRRRKRFRPQSCAWTVSKFIDDFSVLSGLIAFENLEAELSSVLARI